MGTADAIYLGDVAASVYEGAGSTPIEVALNLAMFVFVPYGVWKCQPEVLQVARSQARQTIREEERNRDEFKRMIWAEKSRLRLSGPD